MKHNEKDKLSSNPEKQECNSNSEKQKSSSKKHKSKTKSEKHTLSFSAKEKSDTISDHFKSKSSEKPLSKADSKKQKSTEKIHSHSLTKSNSDKTKHNSSKSNKTEKHKSDKTSNKTDSSTKLQDGEISSSSLIKHHKHDRSLKQSKSSSENHRKGDESKKGQKRKCEENSDDEIYCIKQIGVQNESKPSLDVKQKLKDATMDEEIIDLSSESETDPNEECYRIYSEEYPERTESSDISNKEVHKPVPELNILRKKRLAHSAASNIERVKKQKPEVKVPVNPGQIMVERYAKIAAQVKEQEQKATSSIGHNASKHSERTRIAAVTNHSLLAAIAEKNKLSQSNFSPLPSTVSTNLKSSKRVAHVPDMATKPRPTIPADYSGKVPTVYRQKFLNAFIDEYLKFSSTNEEAYENSLEEEKKAYLRSSSKAIYQNVASNVLARLRKQGNLVSSTTSTKSSAKVSHENVLNGPQAQRTSFSIERKKPPPIPELKGNTLYEYLADYVLTEEQLKENGFPFAHPTEIGKAVIEGNYAHKTQYCNDPFKRTCCRCQKVYYVNVDGNYVRDEECDFHWGRLWKRRIAGALESRYSCCQGDSESEGCCVGTGHVFDGSEAHVLKGYVSTLSKTPPPDKYLGVFSLDCEMCYTTAGMELIRVTVIGPDCKPVYDSFVKPRNKVLDYNTRFSGITEENLKNVKTTLQDVQSVLLLLFSNRTILVGHSLESDFKALKLLHRTVVDTSVVFPHKMGPPLKRALRTLMAEKLNKIIQNDVGGHDSSEDAISCMELMLWKIKEDLKSSR